MPSNAPVPTPAPFVAPPAPPDGYSKEKVKDLVASLRMAVNALERSIGRGEQTPVDDPPDAVFDKEGRMRVAFPAPIANMIAMVVEAAKMVGGKVEGRYEVVDLAALLSSDAGLEELSVLLELIAKDKVLHQRLKEAAKAAPTVEPPKEKFEVGSTTEETTDEASQPGAEAFM